MDNAFTLTLGMLNTMHTVNVLPVLKVSLHSQHTEAQERGGTYALALKGVEEAASHLAVVSRGARLVTHAEVAGGVLQQAEHAW